MAMVDEVLAQRRALLKQHVKSRPIEWIEPTEEIPGSEPKIRILAERAERAMRTGEHFPLHHPQDGRMPLGKGWRIRVGPNGRIINKEIVDLDRAGIVVVLSREQMTEQIRQAIVEQFGKVRYEIESPTPPSSPSTTRLRAA